MNKDLIERLKLNFETEFKTKPILTFAPGRINLIGGHTDYNDGFVFPAAIDKGIVAAIQESNTNISSLIAIDVNERHEFLLNDISPINNGGWKNYVLGIVSEIQKTGRTIKPFNLIFGGDIPRGSGLSSSAALENSVVFGLNELFQLGLSKKEMIFISQKAEHSFAGVQCGIMDQYASMFGKKHTAILLDCENMEASIVNIDLGDHEILIINTEVKHSLAESEYNERRATCEFVVSQLGINSLRSASNDGLLLIKDKISEADYKKARYVVEENNRVIQAFNAIKNNYLEQLGKLLFASHKGLKQQYNVSCNELDFLVDYAKKSSEVIGARMMGGGFGGCAINIIKKKFLEPYINDVAKAYAQKFNIDCSFYTVNLSDGTRIIKPI